MSLLLMLILSLISSRSYSQSDERIIGYVSGTQNAGEWYELYKYSKGSLFDYMAGWKYVGTRDKMVNYSENQIYEICLNKAKKQYRYYSNLSLRDFQVKVENQDLPDTTYYSNEVGTGNEYRRKLRSKRVYMYSATVVVE